MTVDATKDILILQNEPSVPRKKLISLVNSRLECRFVERDELVIVLLIFGISGGLENSSNVPHPVCCCHGSELAPNASAVNGTTTETCAQLTTSANHPASFNTTWTRHFVAMSDLEVSSCTGSSSVPWRWVGTCSSPSLCSTSTGSTTWSPVTPERPTSVN